MAIEFMPVVGAHASVDWVVSTIILIGFLLGLFLVGWICCWMGDVAFRTTFYNA
jgi:hypothetical protein